MLVVVALCLISVLQVVISLGASSQSPDWVEISIVSVGCLLLAGMYLYFWIVVLELFIKMGPLYYMSAGPPPGPGGPPMHPMMVGPYGQVQQGMTLPPHPGAAPPVPVHAVVYDTRQDPGQGPQSMFANPTGQPIMYQQPNSLPPMYYHQANVKQY